MEHQEVEHTLFRIRSLKGVVGVIILSKNGAPLKSTLDDTTTARYAGAVHTLAVKTKVALKQMDESDDLKVIRLRTKKNEIILVREQGYSMIAIHKNVVN
ncbi:Dynein light chain roadblock-type 2 [Bulinus truncatus]|nr:Dynein light chain roadblock-type 2 [Bulinus truncatus]